MDKQPVIYIIVILTEPIKLSAMKTTTTLTLVFWFLTLSIFAQHDHEGLEELFQTKSLAVFENDLELEQQDFHNQPLLTLVDTAYQNFQTNIRMRLDNGDEISHELFDTEYSEKVVSTKQQVILQRELDFPQPVNTPKMLNGPCVNMDFEEGDFNGWDLTRGNVDGSGPYSFVGEFPVGPSAYHQIFAGGVDPVTGIPTVDPLGGAFSARLGNGTGTGARAARMKQTFMVDATNYLYTYSYAVVFESPNGHTLNQLPYFTVRVFDELGNNVPCGEYSVIADAANAPDYLTTNWGGVTVLYKDWQTVFTNLSAYIGQNVTIEFTSGDCSLTGHFGYAYVDASCAVNQIIASDTIICDGDPAILTAPAGAASYLWSTGETTQAITVNSGGIYSCTLTPFQGGGCDIVLDIEIFENPRPVANFTSSTLVACVNDAIDFTDLSTIPNPGVILNYRWDFGDGIITPLSNGPIVAVPNTTGTYVAPTHTYTSSGNFNVELYVESADGCFDNIIIPLTINDIPVVAAGADQTVCDGAAVTLNGAGANTYVWDNGITDGVPFVQGVGTITYTVTGTDANGCENTDQVDVTVNPLPVVNAGADQTVCDGVAVTLNGTGASTYVWDNGITDGVPFVQGVGTITYTVLGTDANGCENTDQVDVTVNPLPVVNAGADQTVCEGSAVTLNGAGATSYVWNNGVTDGVPFLQGVGTITYSVIGTDANGCENTDQVDVLVNPLPVVNAGADQTVCDGAAVTLNGAGANTYVWDNGITDGVPFVQGVGTITYTVTGTDANGCENTDQVDVTVNPLPVVNAGADQTVCDGVAVTLNGVGANTYVWDNGITDGVPFVQGVGTITYTVIGTDANGCENTDQVDVTINPLPVVNAGANQTVCDGAAVTLNGAGATSYVWNNGVTDGVPFVQGVGTITYTVTGTDVNGCQNTDQVDVTINALPNVNAGADQTVCDGAAVTLNGAGANSYVWDNGITDGVPFIPAVGTITYTVIGTDVNGCENTDQVDVTVNPLPVVEAGIDQELCEGSMVTLSGSGAPGYVWDNGVIDGVPFIQAVGTTIYTVIGTDANGCQNTDQVSVLVSPLPIVDAGVDQILCEESMITLTASGANSYQWDNGVIDGVPFIQAVGTITYTVIGTDIKGCQSTDQVDATINALPMVNAGADQTVCDGVAVTLNGAGAGSYIWDNGVIDGVPFIPAIGTITYTLIGTDANGCANSDQVDVTVNPNPTISAGSDQSLCENSWITLSASGAPSIVWDNGVVNDLPFQQGIGTIVYTVTGTLPTGCFSSTNISVTILQNPIVTASDVIICEGEAAVLMGSGAVNYAWNKGVQNGNPFYPNQTDTYTVIGTSANGCSSQAQATVTVMPTPIVDFDVLNLHLSTTDPSTGFDNLSVGAVSYEWNFGDGSSINTEFEPYHTFPEDQAGEYIIELTGYSEYGCSARDIKYVHVFRDYLIYVPNAFTPDNSGVNEVFKPVMTGFDEDGYTMYIFNRWGNLIFETHDMEVGWDGTFHDENNRVQDGVFTWKIEANIKDSNDSKIFVGHVSILK